MNQPFVERLWSELAGEPSALDRVELVGPSVVLPSVYDVTGWAAATIATARLAANEWLGDRGAVRVDRHHACAAFLAEALFSPTGWERPASWDPIAGDYPTADGWVRLHTNYPSHRAAALWALGVGADGVADAVMARLASDVEAAVVGAGGCAAAMNDAVAWSAHPHGGIVGSEPVVSLRDVGAGQLRQGDRLRVLDLTRVIAGPECTRFLSTALGADVLRIDPPGFEDVQALLPETTAGKRTATVDLRTEPAVFERLVAAADVVVVGLRPGSIDSSRWRDLNPALIVASLDAYGWSGPWAERRGFDSIVQMSTGIAGRGMTVYGTDRPKPLPAQALDHGAGFALAAGVCRALVDLRDDGRVRDVRASLVGAANELTAFEADDPHAHTDGWPDALFEEARTKWGPARRVRPVCGTLTLDAGPLGRGDPTF